MRKRFMPLSALCSKCLQGAALRSFLLLPYLSVLHIQPAKLLVSSADYSDILIDTTYETSPDNILWHTAQAEAKMQDYPEYKDSADGKVLHFDSSALDH